jgi:sensor histidine kinase YesM
MERYPFIFSNEKKYRIRRHVIFWLFWFFFFGILYAYTANKSILPNFKRLPVTFVDSLFFLSAHMFLAYSLMYVVVPKFLLKGRYFLSAVAVLVCFVLAAVISAIHGNYILPYVRYRLFDIEYIHPINTSFLLALLAGLRGAITVGGIAVAIKLMKYWYQKEQKNLVLQKENTESQLQLLKSQVHPHFLFNTLNNIYSLTLTKSEDAPVVVAHLSDMLRYMLYECNENEVPLVKEVEMLKKYLELEKLRYGNRIDISFKSGSTVDGLKIAPLLLLPFVENSFKHGVSEQLEQCWINLHLHASGNKFHFHLTNSTGGKGVIQKGGIGLKNIRKRLDLLYAGKYNLVIKEDEDMYLVKLELELAPAVQAIQQTEPIVNLKLQPAV